MKKICFIIPEGGRALASHSAYLEGFIHEVGQHAETKVIIEKNLAVQFPPIRFLLLCAHSMHARVAGCKTFYVHYSYGGVFSAWIITWLFGGKVFYWSCGNMWLFGPQRILRVILKIINTLVTGNETMKQAYHEHLDIPLEKIAIMPNWIEYDRFENLSQKRTALRSELGIDSHAQVVLFLHRLAPRKGSRYLPDIARAMRKKAPDSLLLVAGDGPDESWLKNALTGMDHVRFLGAWPNDRVPELMAASDVYIMPSEEEGFPRVIIEAQAAELPYTGFNAGGTQEISPTIEHQYVFNIGEVAPLNDAIIKLLELDQSKRATLKQELKQHVAQYRREVVVQHFLEIISGRS